MHVTRTITILRSPSEVYGFWRDFGNLPRFMHHLERVEMLGTKRSHWVARAPGGSKVEWDAEVTEDRPNELLAWRSVGDADVRNAGSVRFTPAPGDRGTEVRVELSYDPPGGKLGKSIARLFGEEPAQQLYDDLRRLEQVLEIGEVVRSAGSLAGVGQGVMRQRPSQPSRQPRSSRSSRPSRPSRSPRSKPRPEART